MTGNEISFEAFSASLKRIERQYVGSANAKSVTSSFSRHQSIQRPPDEAAYAFGEGLFRSFSGLAGKTASHEVQEELFAVLANRDVNPGVCQGFFNESLQPSSNEDTLDLGGFFPVCILFAEQIEVTRQNNSIDDDDDGHATCFDPLTCMIRSYAQYTRSKYETNMALKESSSSRAGSIGKTYSKLQTQAGRLAMLRDFTDVAFLGSNFRVSSSCIHSKHAFREMLTPLLSCSVLNFQTVGSDGGNASMIESVLCMEGIWRQTYAIVESASTVEGDNSMHLHLLFAIIEWLTEMLDLFLLSIPARKRHLKIPSKELAHRWLSMVLDVGVLLSQSIGCENDDRQQSEKLMTWFECTLSMTLLRWFTSVPSYRVQMGSFWGPLRTMMEIYRVQRSLPLEVILKLSTMTMCHPIKEDVREMLELITFAVDGPQGLKPIALSILKGLGSVFSRDPIYAATTKHLLSILARTKPIENDLSTSKKSKIVVNMTQLLEDGNSMNVILAYFISHEDNLFDQDHTFSSMQQIGSLLLFGIGLLNENAKHRQAAFGFLKKLLLVYPHLGISVLPVVVDSLNTAAVRGDGESMMEQLEFLAEVLVRDPQCASQVWTLLGKEFMRHSVPAIIRSSIIRLFPKVCHGNKRLYKRIIECMGNTLVSMNKSDGNEEDNSEIRLAIAATTADLARDNFIRDPTDVISWLQDFITDTGWVRSISTIHHKHDENRKGAIARYSILALHYLVVAGELDFKLVLVVLGKKLCNVHNLEEVSRLPPIVLESLVVLLSDGELDDDDSSDEDDYRLKPIGISVQTSRSVETLIGLWNHDCLRPERVSDPARKATICQCKINILNSLTKYSFEALGVDDEGIQAVIAAATNEGEEKQRSLIPTGDRYNLLKILLGDGIHFLRELQGREYLTLNKLQQKWSDEILHDFSGALSSFTSKFIKFEEEILGSSIWQKRQGVGSSEKKLNTKRKGSVSVSKLSEQLPSPKSVVDIYNENRSQATSMGALLSFKGDSSSLLADLAMDATSDPSDMIVQTLYVQSWLNAARNALRHVVSTESLSSSLDKLLNDIEEWRLDSPDSMFMFSSSIAMLIPSILGPHGDFSSYVKEISEDVWEGYNSRLFEDPDVAKLCLGFVGVCGISLGNTDRLTEIVDILEKTVTGYGGLPSFGAYYALSVIAQRCAASSGEEAFASRPGINVMELTKRILVFLFNELSKCFKGSQDAIAILTTGITNSSIKSEDVDTFDDMKKTALTVTKSKLKTSKSIFIALGICLPTITKINDQLVHPTICFLETLQYGCGVGFCLRSILTSSEERAPVGDQTGTKNYDQYSKLFDENAELGVDGLYDILYAMMAFQNEHKPHLLEKIQNFEEDNMGTSSLLLAVSLISTIPCLGHGSGCLFTDSPCLVDKADNKDVATVVRWFTKNSTDMAMMLRGFLASLTMNEGLERVHSFAIARKDHLSGTKLREAQIGTGLETVMSLFYVCVEEEDDVGITTLMRCMENIALPDQFSVMVESLAKGIESVKTASIGLLISQIKGRPRAIFDGRDFVKLALKICKMPIVSIRDILGLKEAAKIFIDAFGEMVTKFLSQEVEIVIENVFRFCIDQIDQDPKLTIYLLESIERILQKAQNDKSPRFSPKCLNSIYLFLQQKAFTGIHNATSSGVSSVPPKQMSQIITVYADCIALVPYALLTENKIFVTEDQICFRGKSLRIQILMNLIRNERCSLSHHSYREVTSSMAWVSQELIDCNECVLSPEILQATCRIGESTSRETSERRREVLVSFLDNLLMVDSSTSFVALQILSALVFQWCHGRGSDGNFSLLPVLGASIEKWADLPSEVLKKTFELALYDLPFNLARFARNEKVSGVTFNRLWRIYAKWSDQGADERTLMALRLSLFSCRDNESTPSAEDIISLVERFV